MENNFKDILLIVWEVKDYFKSPGGNEMNFVLIV